jgi:maltooligosyltrehalose trehalohydrolase
VWEGRRREFASFSRRSDPDFLARVPDPNSRDTFERSRPMSDASAAVRREHLYKHLIALRQKEIISRLDGARSLDARAVGPAAILAQWQMGDDSLLVIGSNLGTSPAVIPRQKTRLLFASSEGAGRAARDGTLEPYSTVVLLETR